MKLPRLSPALGTVQRSALTGVSDYDAGMAITDPSAANRPAVPVPTPEQRSLPSASTIVGWTALVLGTIVTIAIVVVAITLR